MHPLIDTARRTKIDLQAVRPATARYDFAAGMWEGPSGPLCDDPNHIPQSKKADMETGEDQKGQ